MCAGRHRDRDGVNHPGKFLVIRHGIAAIEIRRLPGALRDRVANSSIRHSAIFWYFCRWSLPRWPMPTTPILMSSIFSPT